MATLAIAIAGSALAASAAPDKPLPASSVYQLSMRLTDQNGRDTQLSAWRGKPVIISMFYTSCEFVCPRIVEGVKRTETQLAKAGKPKVPALMVSFDTDRDDVPTLKKAAVDRGIDDGIWTLARADARDVRKLAALLQIQYRALPSGEFNHTSVLILLDAEGRIAGKTFTSGEADPEFVKLVEKTMR